MTVLRFDLYGNFMNINSVNNSLASIQASSLSAKNNGTGDPSQIGSTQSNQLGVDSSVDSSVDDVTNGTNTALDRIKNLPEIRSDVVEAAKEKLESGFYQSREAAFQTAKTILL